MRFGLTAEQKDFGEAAARAFADTSGDRWRVLADLGLTGVLDPESGGDDVDLLAPLEAAGRAAAPEPLVETAVAVGLLRGTDLAERWLPGLTSGETFVAVTEPGTPYAVDADRAALVLTELGGARYAVSHFTTEPRPSVDPARRLFTVSATGGVRLDGGVEAYDRGVTLTSAYLLGVTGQMIDLSVAYAKQRVQFGRPIGSYQAIKHRLADALVALEFARPMVYRAAYSLAHDAPDRSRDASAAKAMASDAALQAAKAALQVHGAIGYTLECDLHHWMRRAWTLSAAWGDVRHHRRRVAEAL